MGLGEGTTVIMYNGTIKKVEDLVIGDLLMGADSLPKKVLNVNSNFGDLYEIIPVKGDNYIVSLNHSISLVGSAKPSLSWHKDRMRYMVTWDCPIDKKRIYKHFTVANHGTKESAYKLANEFYITLPRDNPVIDITLNEYLITNKSWKNNWKGHRIGVNFEYNNIELLIDPYYLGLWLGDGTSRQPGEITNIDEEVINYLYIYAKELGLSVSKRVNMKYGLVTKRGKGNENVLIQLFKKYNLIQNKHIPFDYKIAPREIRLQVLAGLIDTDGNLHHGFYRITQKSDQLAEDIIYLARSCGFAVYNNKSKGGCKYKGVYREGIYNKMAITGHISEIPVLIERKKADIRKQIKDVLHTGITPKLIDQGNYYDIKIENGDSYLLGDFTIIY